MARPSLMVAIGIGKRKVKGDEGPPPSRFTKPGVKEAAPVEDKISEEIPPTLDTSTEDTGATSLDGLDTTGATGVKGITPEEVDYSDSDLCGQCLHMGDDGNCDRYGFPVQESGHCEAGFEPLAGGITEKPVTSTETGGLSDIISPTNSK